MNRNIKIEIENERNENDNYSEIRPREKNTEKKRKRLFLANINHREDGQDGLSYAVSINFFYIMSYLFPSAKLSCHFYQVHFSLSLIE